MCRVARPLARPFLLRRDWTMQSLPLHLRNCARQLSAVCRYALRPRGAAKAGARTMTAHFIVAADASLQVDSDIQKVRRRCNTSCATSRHLRSQALAQLMVHMGTALVCRHLLARCNTYPLRRRHPRQMCTHLGAEHSAVEHMAASPDVEEGPDNPAWQRHVHCTARPVRPAQRDCKQKAFDGICTSLLPPIICDLRLAILLFPFRLGDCLAYLHLLVHVLTARFSDSLLALIDMNTLTPHGTRARTVVPALSQLAAKGKRCTHCAQQAPRARLRARRHDRGVKTYAAQCVLCFTVALHCPRCSVHICS